MGMPHPAEPWTADRVRALPEDGQRYELIDGELVVTPSPRGVHQVAVSVLEDLLRRALASISLHVLHSPADIALGEDEILQPDLFVYRTASGRHLLDWSDITAWLGPRLHAVQYPVRRGELQNIVVIVQGPAPQDLENWDHAANAAGLDHALQGTCTALQDVVRSVGTAGAPGWRGFSTKTVPPYMRYSSAPAYQARGAISCCT